MHSTRKTCATSSRRFHARMCGTRTSVSHTQLFLPCWSVPADSIRSEPLRLKAQDDPLSKGFQSNSADERLPTPEYDDSGFLSPIELVAAKGDPDFSASRLCATRTAQMFRQKDLHIRNARDHRDAVVIKRRRTMLPGRGRESASKRSICSMYWRRARVRSVETHVPYRLSCKPRTSRPRHARALTEVVVTRSVS